MNRLQAFGSIVAQAAKGELRFPTSINAALKLQMALADPDCHIDEAIKLVLGDPVLAARTVALANSAMFGRRRGGVVTSVRAAVGLMGYRNLYTMVAAMVVRQFGSKIRDPDLRLKAELLWEHTAHVATLAHILARRVTLVDADTALFAGIVHEVSGFYLLARADEFPGLLEDEESDNWAAAADELIKREIMKKLKVPEPVSSVVEAMRDSLLQIPPESLLDTMLLAKQLAPVLSPMQVGPPSIISYADSAIEFCIDRELLDSILQESADEVREMNAALLV